MYSKKSSGRKGGRRRVGRKGEGEERRVREKKEEISI